MLSFELKSRIDSLLDRFFSDVSMASKKEFQDKINELKRELTSGVNSLPKDKIVITSQVRMGIKNEIIGEIADYILTQIQTKLTVLGIYSPDTNSQKKRKLKKIKPN